MPALWFQIVALAVLAASVSFARNISPSRRNGYAVESLPECTELNTRKSWTALTNLEKLEYLRAERCLMHHPPLLGTLEDAQNLWDELHHTHIWQGNYIHYVGHFLPWHRYLVRTHEVLLQTVCGYAGAQPYWDELADYESAPLHQAAIFDPVFGFGGDGVGDDACVRDGPFQDTTLHIRAHSANADYCLSRNFSQANFVWANRSNVEDCFAEAKYEDAWPCYNTYPHSAGHAAVGGVMFDPTESNGDPIFYLHHAYLDRLWWQWQLADQPGRLSDIGGVNVPPQEVLQMVGLSSPSATLVGYSGDPGDQTTLAHVLWMNGILPNVTIADVMELGGGCHLRAIRVRPKPGSSPGYGHHGNETWGRWRKWNGLEKSSSNRISYLHLIWVALGRRARIFAVSSQRLRSAAVPRASRRPRHQCLAKSG